MKNKYDFWSALKKARVDYLTDTSTVEFDAFDFETYLEVNYGIKLTLFDNNITDKYVITDEKKYLIFLLKYQ